MYIARRGDFFDFALLLMVCARSNCLSNQAIGQTVRSLRFSKLTINGLQHQSASIRRSQSMSLILLELKLFHFAVAQDGCFRYTFQIGQYSTTR